MAVLLQYIFTANSLAPTTQASNVTGGTIAGTGVYADSSASYTSKPNLRYPALANAVNIATAITYNSYWYFTVTPASGYKIDLTTLTFNAAMGGAGTRGYGVRSSFDTYAASLGTADLATTDPTWTAVSITLTGLTNIKTVLTFRIYCYAGVTGQAVDFDDITLNGTIVKIGSSFLFNLI